MVWPRKETGMRRIVGVVRELEVPGVRHRGRVRKQRKNNIEEDLREMSLREKDATDRDRWRTAIKSPNLVAWSKGDTEVKKNLFTKLELFCERSPLEYILKHRNC